MPITDKTRKVLWVRSGNQCAICKNKLVTEATEADDVFVVGEECHIISPRENGPRHDASYPNEKLDSYENPILLSSLPQPAQDGGRPGGHFHDRHPPSDEIQSRGIRVEAIDRQTATEAS